MHKFVLQDIARGEMGQTLAGDVITEVDGSRILTLDGHVVSPVSDRPRRRRRTRRRPAS
jgi:hypothetical protein